MILVRAFRVIEGKLFAPVILEKYFDTDHLPFDIFDLDNMYFYLQQKYRGVSTKYGDELRYEIYHWGRNKKLESRFKFHRSGYISFYPGYDEVGHKRKIIVYGDLERV